MTNKSILQFHLRTKTLNAAPHMLQKNWEDIYDVPMCRPLQLYVINRRTVGSERKCLFAIGYDIPSPKSVHLHTSPPQIEKHRIGVGDG